MVFGLKKQHRKEKEIKETTKGAAKSNVLFGGSSFNVYHFLGCTAIYR